MSKRDWLKHLGFTTTAAIAVSKIKPMEQSNEPTIEEKNSTIARFMGITPVPAGTKRLGDIKPPEESIAFLNYHERWDLLMPVWIKWRKTVPISSEAEEWTSSLSYYLLTSDEPKRFFERMYYAITWLNQQTTTNEITS